MPKVIEIPGTGNVEFPDDMDDGAIGAVIRKTMPVPGMEKLGGIAPTAGKSPAIDMHSQSPLQAMTGINPAPVNKQIDQFSDTLVSDAKAIPSMVKSIPDAIGKIPGAVAAPFRRQNDAQIGQEQTAKLATDKELMKTNATKAVIGRVAPPMIAEPIQDLAEGNIGRSAARVAEGYVGGKTIQGGMKVPGMVKSLMKDNPSRAALHALGDLHDPNLLDKIPGVPLDNERLHIGLSDIKTHGGGANSVKEYTTAAQTAQKANREAWEAWMQRAGDRKVSGKPIVKATQNSLAGTLDPQIKQNLINEAKGLYDKPHTAKELETLLHEKNGELAGFYAKDETIRESAKQAGARTGRSQSLLEAQAREIREALYNHLHPEGGGVGPRELQNRYGVTKHIENAASRKILEAEAQKPIKPLDRVTKTATKLADVPGRVFHGKVTGLGSEIKSAAAGRGEIDPMAGRAIAAADDATPFPLPPGDYPQPMGLLEGPTPKLGPAPDSSGINVSTGEPLTGRMLTEGSTKMGPIGQPPGVPASEGPFSEQLFSQGVSTGEQLTGRQLGPGSVKMPGQMPKDVNISTGEPLTGRMIDAGSVKPPPAAGEMFGNEFEVISPNVPYSQPIAPANKTLGPASQTQVPGFAVGGETPHKFPDTQDLVPWKNPTTGKIEYVPRRYVVNPPR